MPGVVPTDSHPVAPFSNEIWFVLALLAAGCVVSVLYTLASEAGHVTKVHDIKVRVAKLQEEYHAHLEAMANRDGDSDVIVLNEVPVGAPKRGKHAA